MRRLREAEDPPHTGENKTETPSSQPEAGNQEDRKGGDLDRTKIGLLMVTVSALLQSPYVFVLFFFFPGAGVIALLIDGGGPLVPAPGLLILGALLIVLGSKSFGPSHRLFSILSLAIFVLVDFLILAGVLGSGSHYYWILFLAAGMGMFFLTYDIQSRPGRGLLWFAFAVLLGWTVIDAFRQSGPVLISLQTIGDTLFVGWFILVAITFLLAYDRVKAEATALSLGKQD